MPSPAALGAGAERAEIGAGLRLGEVHGRHPFAGDHARQIARLQRVAAVRVDAPRSRPWSAVGPSRRPCSAPFHISSRAVREHQRQALAAERLGRGDARPSRRRASRCIDAPPAGRGRNRRRRQAARPRGRPTRLSGASSPPAKRPASVRTRVDDDPRRAAGNARSRRVAASRPATCFRVKAISETGARYMGSSSASCYTPTLDAPPPAGETRACAISS